MPGLVAYTIYQGKKLTSPRSASREPKALPWADLLWPCRPEAKCAQREGTEESSSLPLLILHFTNDMTPSRGLGSTRLAGFDHCRSLHPNNSVCVTATKALIEKWIALSVHFVQEQKFQSLGARVDVLLKSRGVEKTAAGRGRWR